jgi:hypothetical protein
VAHEEARREVEVVDLGKNGVDHLERKHADGASSSRIRLGQHTGGTLCTVMVCAIAPAVDARRGARGRCLRLFLLSALLWCRPPPFLLAAIVGLVGALP